MRGLSVKLLTLKGTVEGPTVERPVEGPSELQQ